MLSKDVNFYYRQILEKYPNSYFTQDLNKVIIGIDCEYLDANSITFSELKAKFYEYAAGEKLCEYAGFFGVLSADFIHLFEISKEAADYLRAKYLGMENGVDVEYYFETHSIFSEMAE